MIGRGPWSAVRALGAVGSRAVNRLDLANAVPLVPPVPPVPGGRVFTAERPVRLGDVSPRGRLRLDAVVRYLQDVSDDDTRDSGLADGGWVVRRTFLRVDVAPVYREPLRLTTWCSATGQRWAERRVSITGDAGRVEAAVLWVCVDPSTMRPARLAPDFVDIYGPSTGGRTVSSRLVLDPPPDSSLGPPADTMDEREPWPLRVTDFDALRHVNNAAVWEVVEEYLARRRDLRAPFVAVVEHPRSIEQGDDVTVTCHDRRAAGLGLWLHTSEGIVAAAAVAPAPSPTTAGT